MQHTGQVTRYTVSPALPAGLSVNGVNGTIAGTPTAAAAQATYTITASNSAGSTTVSVVIVVNPTAPTVAYASPAYSFTVGVTAGPIKPTVSAGSVTSWGISPALPAGLAFSTTTGTISGTGVAEVEGSGSKPKLIRERTFTARPAPLSVLYRHCRRFPQRR
jgi:hypothetical protein